MLIFSCYFQLAFASIFLFSPPEERIISVYRFVQDAHSIIQLFSSLHYKILSYDC